jgi:mono/diheme cytochrome c family protein
MRFVLLILLLSLWGAPALADAAAAKKILETHCSSCHGPEGKGDGAAAAAMTPRPASFYDAERFAKRTDAQLVATIRGGGASTGLSPLMPAWQGIVDEVAIEDLVAYIRAASGTASAPQQP